MPGGWVYIAASRYRGTLYTGVTADIAASNPDWNDLFERING